MKPNSPNRTGPNRRAYAVDLVVVCICLILMAALLAPVASRVRELSKRRACAVNLKSIGNTCAIYASENNGAWPIPPFREVVSPSPNIKYVNTDGTTGIPNIDPGEIGWQRWQQSTSQTFNNPSGGSTAVSTTRSFWLLIRNGDATVQQFVCPSSTDSVDPTENIELYYDFLQYANISYGYQVPYGPTNTRPRDDAHPSKIFAADKGPFYTAQNPNWRNTHNEPVSVDDAPLDWQPYNSPNHGGRGSGEGQNCLFADTHVSFERRPTAGLDDDNIYTHMADVWGHEPFNRTHGWTPHVSPFPPNPFPGEDTLGRGIYSSTDTLIYP